MRPKTLKIVIISQLVIIPSLSIWWSIKGENGENQNFLYDISVELLGGVITIILLDIIIGNREKRGEEKATLLRDLYSDEEDIRILALDQLLKENLLNHSVINNVDFRTLNLKGRLFEKISFFKCKFFGTQLENSTFRKCRFMKTDFSGANLNNSTFDACFQDNCDFSGSFFEESSISNSKFDTCNLNNSRFVNSHIFNSIFNNCSANSIVREDINIDNVSAETFPDK